jgi:hypothetical protein
MRDQILALYERYGFKPQASANPETHLVFTIAVGYFHQAELLVLDGTDEDGLARTRDDLQASGFSCSTRIFSSIETLENRLFTGFFGTTQTRQRHLEHYASFTTNVSRTLDGPYEYISAQFSHNGVQQPNRNVVSTIVDAFESNRPTIILLEAAAGFGKTCTAYEVLAHLVRNHPERPPIFIELARNRQATIFRYVLLDEIDRNYPALKRDLVESEIKSGNVPLIIDGFDELLHRSTLEAPGETANHIETMLDTVAMLLENQAKVLITTRRTAIFSDADFDTWCDQYKGRFAAERLVLHPPVPQDWVGATRSRRIDGLGSASFALANPVLLSSLRNLDDADFESHLSNLDLLVTSYFRKISIRELDRQDINIPHDEQLTIFRRLAEHFLAEDISTESDRKISEIIRNTSKDILERSQASYPSGTRPTVEQLSDKLARHAFLDRVSNDSAKTGFVNEFVAGTFFAEVIEEKPAALSSERVLDLSTFAYSARSLERRTALYRAVEPMLPALTTLERLSTNLRLKNSIDFDIRADTIEGVHFNGCRLGLVHTIQGSVFVNCTFKGVHFFGRGISNCGFVQCRFYDCIAEGSATSIWHKSCVSSPDENFLDLFSERPAQIDRVSDVLEVDVLRQFWPKGRAHSSNRLSKRTIYRGFAPDQRNQIDQALESLRLAGLLRIEADVVHINIAKISDIRGRIGR